MDTKITGYIYASLLLSLTIIGMMFTSLSNYKTTSENLHKEVVLYKSDKLLTDAALVVLETSYFNKVEDFNTYETLVANVYKDKLVTVRRNNAIIKNILFINHLAYNDIDQDYIELIAAAFYDAAIKYNIDQKELIATAWHESRFKQDSRSKAGALGIMQIMPLWLSNASFETDLNIKTIEDLYDPIKNIHAGAFVYNHYKAYWTKRGYKNPKNIKRLALLSYNRGHKRVSNLLRQGKNPANGYYKVIKTKYNKLAKLEAKL